jgi:hypothetical protein
MDNIPPGPNDPGFAESIALTTAPTLPPEPMNAMVDIETLGRRPFCPVLAIGACVFRLSNDGVVGDPNLPASVITDVFYQAIDLESCLQVGLKIDADTLKWWLVGDKENPENSPTDAARQQTFADPAAVSLPLALDAFTTWINSRPLRLWGNSARFDLGIIEAAYVACGKVMPWEFYNERCYRTIKNLQEAREVKLVRFGTHHNALDDAISQALHLKAINERLHLQL